MIKKQPSTDGSFTTPISQQQQQQQQRAVQPSSAEAAIEHDKQINRTKPVIVGGGEKKKPTSSVGSFLTRATPGKSASFKQAPVEKKPNLIRLIFALIMYFIFF